MNSNIFARLGAITYILWGLMHLLAARMVFALGQSLQPGMVQGRIYQSAANLLFLALFAIVVAVFFNWRNSRRGYWLNLIVVGAADVGFIVFILLPGLAPILPGALGPLLWIIALIFSTIGIRRRNPDMIKG